MRLVREPYSVYIGSWNVNAKVVSEEALVGLEKWILGSQLQVCKAQSMFCVCDSLLEQRLSSL